MVKAFGIETNHGDGNNVQEVSSYVKIARDKILSGHGPQFLEFNTYRWREHCGPNYDNDIGYREEEEFLEWVKKDPLKSVYDNKDQSSIKELFSKFNEEIKKAHQFADNSEFPSYEDFQHIVNS